MKYKIYEKSETLERYSVKKNLFNKKYTVKLHYVNSRYYAVYEAKDKFDLLEYERFLLDRMNNQMMDLLESDEVVNNVDLMITEKDEKFKKISNIVSFSIPLIFSFAYKNCANILLYLPLKLISNVMQTRINNDYKEDIIDDMQKYGLFSENIEILENYGKYVNKKGHNITANTIDKYSFSDLEAMLKALNTLIENGDIKPKTLQKEMS